MFINCLLVAVGAALLIGHAVVPIPVVTIAGLIGQADVIVVGTVTATADQGAERAELETSVIQGRRLSATIEVEQWLRGVEAESIRITFVQPDEPIGYRSVSPGSRGIFFLKRSGDDLRFVTPYYPYLPAAPDARAKSADVAEQVIEIVSGVLTSSATSL